MRPGANRPATSGANRFITGYSGYNAQEGTNVDNGLHGATITAVPEPSVTLAAGVVAAGVWFAARRRKSR